MRKAIVLSLIIIIAIISSCKNQQECPAFDRNLLVWAPYEKNDTIKFENNKNDTINFIISEKTIYDHKGIYKNGCFSECSVYCVDNGKEFNYKIHNYCDDCIQFSLNIFLNNKSGSFSLDTDKLNDNIINETAIDNKKYTNVIIIKTDTIKYPNLSHFWKIIIAKNKGVVKFYDRIDNETWTLIE